MVNRYYGNTGRVQRITEQTPPPERERPHTVQKKQIPLPKQSGNGIGRSLNRIMDRLSCSRLDQQDMLLMMILFLLYRETGDREFLITLIAFIVL